MPETKQPTVVQLTDEELAIVKPFFEAADAEVAYFKTAMEKMKATLLNRVLALRTATEQEQEAAPISEVFLN